MIYLRADGQVPASDPVLKQQFEMDRTVCRICRAWSLQVEDLLALSPSPGRAQEADQVGQGCMAGKGYVLVREDEAAAKQQELAAIAAEKSRRNAAAL